MVVVKQWTKVTTGKRDGPTSRPRRMGIRIPCESVPPLPGRVCYPGRELLRAGPVEMATLYYRREIGPVV